RWSQSYQFGEWVENGFNRFRVLLNDNLKIDEDKKGTYSFVLNDYQSLLRVLRGYKIEPINREASILEISLRGNIKEKSADFLNKLTDTYVKRGLENKNQIAESTIEFIDRQLIDIQDSLQYAEIALQDFQTN
ncbi:hypothetical protein RZS08_27415, partial [Arthrospira platensis SPKY1]|nr:hypothetical protein [Arthrospira platensis SPKY1]